MNIGHTWELEDVGIIIIKTTYNYHINTIIKQIVTMNWKYLVIQDIIYSTSHLSCVTTPMTQVETSCTVYLKGSTPKCSTLDSSTHGERHRKSGRWTMMNNPGTNWARPQWMANYWAQKLSTKVHDIIKTPSTSICCSHFVTTFPILLDEALAHRQLTTSWDCFSQADH